MYDSDDVLDELRAIRRAIEDRGSIGGLIFLGLGLFLIASWDGSWADKATGRAWYAFRYDADMDHVTVDNRPSDCDWMTAPLGSKRCSYKKNVTTFIESDRNQAVANAKTPEEKKQYEDTPNSVNVYWGKVNDD